MQVSAYHRKIADYKTRQSQRLKNAIFLPETPGIRKQKDVRIPPEPLIWGLLHPHTVQVGQERNILPFSLAKNRYTMGRAADNDIVLEDPDVGRYHLVFEHDPVKHCATITTHSSRGVLIYSSRLGLPNSYLQRGVPYPLCDQDTFALGGLTMHTWTFNSYVGQLVPLPSTEYKAEYEAVLLRVLPAVQEHVRDMACRPRKAKPEAVDPEEVDIDSVHTDARLLTKGDAKKMLAFHLILGHLNPPGQPKYPLIPMPPENNDGKTLTETERVRSPTPPPPNPLLTQVPPPPRTTRRLREEWPVGAMFGEKDKLGRLPPMRGYSPDPTSWDLAQYDEYGIEGHPSTRQPESKAGPSRSLKRSRDSVDSSVSGPSNEERPAQRRRSPAPPPETPAQARRRLPPTRTRQPASRPSRQPTAGPSSRLATGASRQPTAGPSRSQASASNSRKRSRDEDEDDDTQSFSSAEVKADLVSSPSPSPAPAPKKRRTQKQSTLESEPDVKPRPKTRAQVQVQPTRRSQRLAARPDDESRAPPRAAPLASVAGANTAAKGKARAGGTDAGRRRR
ncbi:hypothetical protein PENSPDRAFT_693485 [Peniophora sp. CONT]|nr:hypothetical protein PENSPDRAFT_693485 [Peniophora sp. CONT]